MATASSSGSGSGEVIFTGRRWDLHEIEAGAGWQVLPAMSVPRLTLRSVETRSVSIPLKRPVVSKVGRFDRWPLVLNDLHNRGRHRRPQLPRALSRALGALHRPCH